MDNQFRCGKCSKPIASKYVKCMDCGFLGPHTYNAGGAIETEGNPPPQSPRRKDSFAPERVERQQPPASRPNRYIAPLSVDAPGEPPPNLHSGSNDEEQSFPVGIRTSPMLNHIYEQEKGEKKEPRRHREKEKDWDYVNQSEDKRGYTYIEDEEAKPRKSKTGGTSAMIAGIILVVLLIVGALYVINNFDDVTRWLASPTIPEFFKPAEPQPPSANSSQQSKPVANLPSSSANGNSTTTTSPPQPADKTPPVISDESISSITEHEATITWRTSEPCTSKVLFKTAIGQQLNHPVADKLSKDHRIVLNNLDSGTTYYLILQCQNDAGIIVKKELTFVSATDKTPPQLSGQPIVSAADSSATISWKTNEKADSQIKYGLSTGYEFKSGINSEPGTEHSIFLSGLSADTTYHYQVISKDIAGNIMTSVDYTFRTESQSDAAPYMGSRAPNFTIKKLDGSDVSLSQYRGKKVILNFWASWCTPCKVEIPHLQAIWDKYRNSPDVMLLTIAGSESDEDAIRSFIANGNYTFTVCLDSSDSVFNKYDLTSLPRTYFIDKGGIIRRIQQGMFTSPGEVEFVLNSY